MMRRVPDGVVEALNELESAQHAVEDAAVRLSVVAGMADEWSAIVELHASVKATWHRVERAAGNLHPRRVN